MGLLDEIEADHGRASPNDHHVFAHSVAAPPGALACMEHGEPFHLPEREDESPLGLCAAAGISEELAAMGGSDCGDNMSPPQHTLPSHAGADEFPALLHNQNCMSVEEELSQLLAD